VSKPHDPHDSDGPRQRPGPPHQATPPSPTHPPAPPSNSELRLERSRRLAEDRLAEVREAVVEEAGRVPRNATLVLAGLAAAVGFALAFRRRRRRDREG
jgi:LPXTG-motif cell wall-anchored protein